MSKEGRGMDAVVTKAERRHAKAKGAFRRKGVAKDEAKPGIAIMIGVPKAGPSKDRPMRATPKNDVQAEIAELKARLIALEAMLDEEADEDEDAMDDDMDDDEDEA